MTRCLAPRLTLPSWRASALLALALSLGTFPLAHAQTPDVDPNEPGVLEPVLSALTGTAVRIPNTDQSVDGVEQSTVHGDIVLEEAVATTSMLGHPITHVASPNDDMRFALQSMLNAAKANNISAMQAAARDLMDILLGTTQGRIYDGFSMLNFNRWSEPSIGAESFPPDVVPGEYKMKVARNTGETFVSPFDGQTRKIWEVDINLLYYDGQIDSDTFLLVFPLGHHADDTVRVNYRIFSLVQEDFSPTMVMLDKRMDLSTVSFPFKGMDSVWIAFNPGQVLNVTVNYAPVRMLRGVYTWGWRDHPPRIQFLQPLYEMENAHTGKTQFDPQGISFAVRNREDLTISTIATAAPEMKMYQAAKAALEGASPTTIEAWLTQDGQGPRGTWIDWAELALNQKQLPAEAWEMLAADGLRPGFFGDYNMVSVYMNNEMYGQGPFDNEIKTWVQSETFRVKLINLDRHTHYFRNVDFGSRLHDDILRCCGGGETSFEIMNFKPSYGAPKVAEVQWRAGWGFRPHYDVIQQQNVFPRAKDRARLAPYTSGAGETFFGYQYSDEARGGDFRFNPPPFIIGSEAEPSPNPLKDKDGLPGLLVGQFTEGYGVAQMCPEDPFPGFCSANIAQFNPFGTLNWPPPPLQGVNGNPDHPTELRFPPFLRNPSQGVAGAGDILPPTGAWETFTYLSPQNGTIYLDPNDKSKGHWADLTYAHGAPVFAQDTLDATIELPRASGQVFYQFDDLFHDNSIFSPHPVFTGFGEQTETDQVSHLQATVRSGTLRVRGQLSEISTNQVAGWVTVYSGAAGGSGCTGTVLGNATVNPNTGRFIFRQKIGGAVGQTVCVQSTIGGFSAFTMVP